MCYCWLGWDDMGVLWFVMLDGECNVVVVVVVLVLGGGSWL